MSDIEVVRLQWSDARRIISTRHPAIDLFEDLLDPEDWGPALTLEGRTSARLSESVGMLDLVPPERRVGGPGASYLMAPFTHVSPERPGRFHDGTFGAYYAAINFETAVAETCHHQAAFFRLTQEAPGWFAQYKELVGGIDNYFHDLRALTKNHPIYDPDDWRAAQKLGDSLRADESNGMVYRSVRNPGGECVAVYWPDVIDAPVQGRMLAYHFDGNRIDIIRDEANGELFRMIEA